MKKTQARERERERKKIFPQPKNTLQTLWKMLPGLFPPLTEPIFRIKISRVVNKHVFSSPGAIPRHQMVLKKCFFLHHRTFLKCPWLKGGNVLLDWSINRLCCLSKLGRPWASHRARIFSPVGALEEEQRFSSSAASRSSPWMWLDFLRPSERCWGLPNPTSLC